MLTLIARSDLNMIQSVTQVMNTHHPSVFHTVHRGHMTLANDTSVSDPGYDHRGPTYEHPNKPPGRRHPSTPIREGATGFCPRSEESVTD
jgi:hypothetical protein